MAGQNYTWQVSNSTFIGTGEGRVSSAYNKNGKSPFTTITTSNPNGWVSVNPSSNDQTIKKLERRIDEDGVITYRYNNSAIYSSLQKFRDAVPGVSDFTITQIKSAVASELRDVSKQNNIGPPVASLPPTASVPGTGPAGNQVGTPPPPVPNAPEEIKVPEIESDSARDKYDNYYYPESLRGNQNKQDIIRFTSLKYVGRGLGVKDGSQSNFGTPGLGNRDIKTILGSVTLPIQPSITDTNSVQWGSEDLNPLQAFGAAVSYGAQTDIAGAAQQTMNAVENLAKTSGGNMSEAFKVYLAGKAVGVNGLLSRVGGAVLNPNMELLFQGPQLRPFNFTFRLSPRNEKEAQQVKYIIRFFKENMSVQSTADNIFLKTPNVFQINYKIRGEEDHPSLNRIKMCALQSCSVDYTPDGSYMTFNDENATMTSYSLSLQFQELEPVTSRDYTELNQTIIGY
jgi:hypothetical protein